MQIEIIEPDPEADISLFNTISERVFLEEKKPVHFLNIIFMGRDALRSMKQEYFGQDVYTDVIAFNLNEENEAVEGEVYLSFEQIKLNAAQYSTDSQDELHRVLIHGCLHLCGYEDDTSTLKHRMTGRENFHLSLLNEENA
ncbi:MAG: rRNA maturation RNase YbeY [Candidatus Marinimicrobia bacterium]|nr:rRNA maturation RNase YbeY [Candidatus Neomarinimicrobiota bacterium]MCF7850351.1 rRNA maturation RNase YbeY [Candidatus Neomarinimicrobiota bacterium]MCF7904922.1 rRNA maturation RNase YbeY [Candidatus Neomarinimicrobiota bacterium]